MEKWFSWLSDFSPKILLLYLFKVPPMKLGFIFHNDIVQLMKVYTLL